MRANHLVFSLGICTMLALAACSPQGSAPSPGASSPTATSAAAPVDAASCSSLDAKGVLDELVWEGIGRVVTRDLYADRVPDVTAAAKAHFTLSLQGVTTVPGQNGARPTCEATIVGTNATALEPSVTWFQRAAQLDPNVRVRGAELHGAVAYTVQPSDDGKSIRVNATGVEPFAMAMAGFGIKFSNEERLAQREAEQRAGEASGATSATVKPTVATAPEAGSTIPTAADLQSTAEADYLAADKALNAAYAAARGRLGADAKVALRDEQREWIKTRDASCSEARISEDSKGLIVGGSAMALELAGCKARLTEARAKQLAARG